MGLTAEMEFAVLNSLVHRQMNAAMRARDHRLRTRRGAVWGASLLVAKLADPTEQPPSHHQAQKHQNQ
jgi:hypothetical protein